ncbi:unnamed protein product [Leuciscus chuanchicus]
MTHFIEPPTASTMVSEVKHVQQSRPAVNGVETNGDQHRTVKYSSVSPSWPFQAKGAVIIRSQSSQEVGWGLGNVSPSSTPLFFSPFNPLSISLFSSERAFLQLERSHCRTRVDKTGRAVSISVMCLSM